MPGASHIESAFVTIVQRQAGALLVGAGAFLNSRREQIAALAARHELPAMYFTARRSCRGLMSYGVSVPSLSASRGLRGGSQRREAGRPAVIGPRIRAVINLKTAKVLGLEVPPTCSPAPMR